MVSSIGNINQPPLENKDDRLSHEKQVQLAVQLLQERFGANWRSIVQDIGLSELTHIYHNIVLYSGKMWGNKPHNDDLSRCNSYEVFI